jgi:hydroxysqualene dehydroxylase
MGAAPRLAVVGAGWAGLAAAVRASQAGWHVQVFEMSATAGGRARSVIHAGQTLDNGQHILIGAYARCLDLMRTVGVDPAQALLRTPLNLCQPDGRGLALPAGPPLWAAMRGLLGVRGLALGDRARLLATAAGWAAKRFQCPEGMTVDGLCRSLSKATRELLIEPLCVAALNTSSAQASARVFLRVLRDALFTAPGSADLLLPRQPLDALLPAAAVSWLQAQGQTVHLGRRARTLSPLVNGWSLDGQAFDAVVLACPAREASRLVDRATDIEATPWRLLAEAMAYEPIITVYLQAGRCRLPRPMVALAANDVAPAQFVFDHGQLGGPEGRWAAVISGARPWVDRGLDATAAATSHQVSEALGPWLRGLAPIVLHTWAEKRATFQCVPGLKRPPLRIARRLLAAGDYVQGPYPSTLEGAVRAGEAAIEALLGECQNADFPASLA